MYFNDIVSNSGYIATNGKVIVKYGLGTMWNEAVELRELHKKTLIWLRIQEVLGRTNRLLPLIRHGPHWKRRFQQFFYCCACIRYHGNVFTEPLAGNDRGIIIEPLPGNDKGIFTEPLPSNDKGIHIHTLRQQRGLISLLYFFKLRKVG
jgi:hypothetical protein